MLLGPKANWWLRPNLHETPPADPDIRQGGFIRRKKLTQTQIISGAD